MLCGEPLQAVIDLLAKRDKMSHYLVLLTVSEEAE
jgi:hypothetical protein